ncbi:hypothetical protein EOD42_22245 [Rhodovarius crocodyli]|uniref:Uncharacterized protein n=1 Tax=Rhodovarius crocodyli TaxID=1979269 RepID=A0A437M132_9PROT|nr:hypothetical protein [Rhodovarius crocodyli]RVT91378.1 hypothetical protein EOD42_22245 [Rhodovarius crocodyli]
MTTENSTAPAAEPGAEPILPPVLDAEGRLMLRMVQHWIEGVHAEPTTFVPQAWEARMTRLQELHAVLYSKLAPEIRLRDSVLATMTHFMARPEQMGAPYDAWLAVTQQMLAQLVHELGGEIGAYLAATEQQAKVQ